MTFTDDRKIQLKNKIETCLRQKFSSYHPESVNMPFHFRLLGRDRMALYSFIHSLSTSFGISIYEPVALELAQGRFIDRKTQVQTSKHITSAAENKIQEIMNDITTASRQPNSNAELDEIRAVCQIGSVHTIRSRKVDVFLKDKNNKVYFLDIKTAKPNITDFEAFKRMLLTWAAAEMYQNPTIEIQPIIAIPYNPYEPARYNRWTMRGIFDLEKEVLVADELWDFIGGEGSYSELLDVFEAAGNEMRPEIDLYFKRFV